MEIIGWIGTALVIAAYYPQIHHLYVERCAWGISLTTWWIWLVSSLFLLTYAFSDGSTLFVLVQAINMLAIVTTIFLAKRSNNVCPYHLRQTMKAGHKPDVVSLSHGDEETRGEPSCQPEAS
ncbi:MAG TPA: PQ-loop repeat-containing protein [Pyrinomonadaceae bacterium]|nr:PQ-loop repeat-containing protein [Pyrinomonadaceae bacterium]